MPYDQLMQKANNQPYASDEIVQLCLDDIQECKRIGDHYRLIPEYRYRLQNRIEQIEEIDAYAEAQQKENE
jgi:hypothetical protein